MRRSLLVAAALVLSITGCIDDSPTGSPQEIQLQLSNVSGCHGPSSTALVNSSNCAGCDSARAGTADWSQCINTTAHSLGSNSTLQFQRGFTYEVSAALRTGGCRDWGHADGACHYRAQHDNVTWGATGSGLRPIIRYTSMPDVFAGGSVRRTAVKVTGHNVSLVNLDIRGTSYGRDTVYASENYGINAGEISVHTNTTGTDIFPAGLRLDNVSVNGFRASGMLWTGTDLTVQSSSFRHNSGTGLQLFTHTVTQPPGVVVRDSDISYNGGDGIDMTSSYALIADNTISGNGWLVRLYGDYHAGQYWGGERYGIILNPSGGSSGATMDSVNVRGNDIGGNELSGITLISDEYDYFKRIKIDDNEITGHANGWAVLFGKRYNGSGQVVGDVRVESSFLRRNCSFNNQHDWDTSFPGVTAQYNITPSNGCPEPQPMSVTINGPTTGSPYTAVTVNALVSNSSATPFSYEWRVGGAPKSNCPTSQNWCSHVLGGQGTSAYFTVGVTDANGKEAGDYHMVMAQQQW